MEMLKMNVEKILKERGESYGSFIRHSQVAQALKEVAKYDTNWLDLPQIQKEALEMIFHKVARILNGDYTLIDNYADIAGYATLVANDMERQERERAGGLELTRQEKDHAGLVEQARIEKDRAKTRGIL
jgi:nucleoid-associated protein YejK